LEAADRGNQFQYMPMQDGATLGRYGITPADCEAGMILIDTTHPEQRWQGSAAAEEIGRLLPLGNSFVQAYRALPGVKPMGDQLYTFVRDRRYELFGHRLSRYDSAYPLCDSQCSKATGPN
ncbi:MAG: DCC1-like thiol-disulfide oxidoreductase family protein, partial [Cyanobacteria bacterium J06638_6]